MNDFYEIHSFSYQNTKYFAKMALWLAITFIAITVSDFWLASYYKTDQFRLALESIPLVFSILGYVIVCVSLSFFSFKGMTKIIYYTAVVTDHNNRVLVNEFFINLFIINVLLAITLCGYFANDIFKDENNVHHIFTNFLVACILPLSYSIRVLERCIDKIITLEQDILNFCQLQNTAQPIRN